jgi:copper(I)-binding protein
VAGDLEVRDAFAFAPVTQESGAAYFRVINHGSLPDTLADASSAIAGSTAVHRSMAGGGGMMANERIAIPARGELVLEPGGRHLMLMKLSRLPRTGDTIPITLHFLRAGTIVLDVPVRDYGQ